MKKIINTKLENEIYASIIEVIYKALIPKSNVYQMTREYLYIYINDIMNKYSYTLSGSKHNIIMNIHNKIVNDGRFNVQKGQGNISSLSRNSWIYTAK